MVTLQAVIEWIANFFHKICESMRKRYRIMMKELILYLHDPEVVPLPKILGGYFYASNFKIASPSRTINGALLTHIYYAFLDVNEDGTLSFQNEPKAVERFRYPEELIILKFMNPHLKLLFSCVGVTGTFSKVAADAHKRRTFIDSAVITIQQWRYDGLDLNWEFPKETDKQNFTKLVKELKKVFDEHDYILSAAVRAIPVYDDSGYDVPELAQYLDIINVMTYDFYGAWSNHTANHAALYPSSLDSDYERKYLNVQGALQNWMDAGAPKDKICMGIPFFGRSFTLLDPEQHGIHAPVNGVGIEATCTYYQVHCKYSGFDKGWDEETKSPYRYRMNQWIGYDNTKSVIEKVKYGMSQDIAGFFVWHLAGDDLDGIMHEGHEQHLLTILYEQIMDSHVSSLMDLD